MANQFNKKINIFSNKRKQSELNFNEDSNIITYFIKNEQITKSYPLVSLGKERRADCEGVECAVGGGWRNRL